MKKNMWGKVILSTLLFMVSCGLILTYGSAAARQHTGSSATAKSGKTADLTRPDVMYGTVKDAATAAPIANAVVELKNAHFGLGYYRTKTDKRGAFRIHDFIKHITYKIEVTADGYITHLRTADVQSGGYNVTLQREGIVSGVVTNSANKPLAGVEVKLNSSGAVRHHNEDEEEVYSGLKPQIVTTDNKGRYRFNKIAAGRYLATFQKAGYIPETAQIKNIDHGEKFNLPMQMFRPASLSGRIMIRDINVPAADIDITLKGLLTQATISYQDGSFKIDDIKPGNYKLSLSHRGFDGFETEPLTIKEGKVRKDLDFSLKVKDPDVEVYSDRYTYVIGQQIGFNLKTFRLEKVKARIYRLPIDIALKGRIDSAGLQPERDGLQLVREWEEGIRDFKPYVWREQHMDIAQSLPAGSYCIEVSGEGKTQSRKLFSVTSIGIVVKRSLNSVLAYATDLTGNMPVSGAPVIVFDLTAEQKAEVKADDPPVRQRRFRKKMHLYNPPGRLEELPVNILVQGKTGEDGTFLLPVKSEKALAVMAVGADGSYAFCNTGSPEAFHQEKEKVFIYTDRPVYRAGDKVYYKIIGKTMDTPSWPLKGRKLFYQIVNTDVNAVVENGALTLDDWGAVNQELQLKNDTRLGTYEIKAGWKEQHLYSTGKFYVDQYRKPEFKVEVSATKEFFINRDTVDFKVEAKYLFGSPLKGALARYRFYERKLRDQEGTSWWEEEREAPRAYNKIKLEGDKYLDDNGIAHLKIASGDLPYDRELTLEVAIVDKANTTVAESATVKVGRGDYYIKIRPAQGFFAAEEKKEIEISAVGHNGKPRSASLEVMVYRYLWRPLQRVYVHERKPVFAAKVETGEAGTVKMELPERFELGGEFDIVVQGKDKDENIITASRVVWIYGHGAAKADSRFRNIELSVSEAALPKPGEITCLVKSRYADSHVLLTIEGKDIYEKKLVKLVGNLLPVKLIIKEEYTPNVFITATMQRGRALFTSSTEVTLPNSDATLNIELTADKEKYLPGDKARIKIKAVNEAGKPVRGDISLGVVDEAIYLIRRDHTPRMKDFFYAKNSNWVLTSYSFPFTILAGVGKEGKVKIREKFADTAYWNANIRTGEDGLASVEFTLPDNLTTWRLTARGHDPGGRVGEKKNEILVTQDLIARIGKPRFFINGDKVGLIGIVNSNTKRGLAAVATEFRVDDRLIAPEKKVKMSLPAFGVASDYYSITIPEGKNSVGLFYKAVADARARDALKISLPVYSRGVDYKLYGVGDMGANRVVELTPLRNTDDFIYRPAELAITVNPSPISQLLRGSEYLANFPYGCIEQTINGFLPALALKNLLRQKGMTAPQNDKLDEKIKAGVERIQGYQNEDGTWGWWSGDGGNEFLTGYVLYSLHMAKSFGYAVDTGRINNALAALGQKLQMRVVNDDDARIFIFYAQTLWGRWSDGAFNEFINKADLNPYCRAYLIMAMANAEKIDMDKDKKALIRSYLPPQIAALKGRQKRDRFGVYWEQTGNQSWRWPGGNTEITAHALAALVAGHDNSPLSTQIVNSLMKRSRGAAWKSTKETATVIFSVCEYYQELGKSLPDKGKILFTLDGIKIANFEYDAAILDNHDKLTKKIRLAQIAPEKNFRIEASGNAGTDVSFNLTVSGHLYFKENRFLPSSKSGENISIFDKAQKIAGGLKETVLSVLKPEGKGMVSLDNGLSLARSFYKATRVRDVNNNEYLVPQPIEENKGLKIGDEILVKIKFRAQNDLEFLVLEDYLPAGFEVVKKNVYDDYQPYSHSERWDNRMVFFVTKTNANQVYEIGYTMRAELPGEFLAKPARMECMYEPSIQGWSAPAKFTIRKK